jgi:predicted nuclease of predicted toxin-antitoxin system
LSLRLLVDEDTQAAALIARLRIEGHDVLTVNEAGIRTEDDRIVFELARMLGRVVLTYNGRDFERLHEQIPQHFGTIAVYRDRDASKDMSYPQIAASLRNLELSGWDLADQFVALNAWNY